MLDRACLGKPRRGAFHSNNMPAMHATLKNSWALIPMGSVANAKTRSAVIVQTITQSRSAISLLPVPSGAGADFAEIDLGAVAAELFGAFAGEFEFGPLAEDCEVDGFPLKGCGLDVNGFAAEGGVPCGAGVCEDGGEIAGDIGGEGGGEKTVAGKAVGLHGAGQG